MDDIAKNTGMSKKTIYGSFKDKSEIVDKIVSEVIENHSTKVHHYFLHSENAIEEVANQVQATIEVLSVLKPKVIYDIQKYFPEIFKSLLNHQQSCILKGIEANLARGIREGLYRATIDVQAVAQIRLKQLSDAFNHEDFASGQLDAKALLYQVTELYLYGITTPNRQQFIPQYLKQK
jgi:AcrR family transcriptional regulator